MESLSQIWYQIQGYLFPYLEDALGPLSDKDKKLVAILELIRIEQFIPCYVGYRGRPAKERRALARAYVAKMVYNLSTTRELIDRLAGSRRFRRLCGWERVSEIPSESTFSRSFKEFSLGQLPHRVHEALIQRHNERRLVGHISRDSTDIKARERAQKKPKKPSVKRRPGRPRKGECSAAKKLSYLDRQPLMTLEQMLADLPKACDYGVKKKDALRYVWKGYKLHVDWADGEIPISCVLSSASLNDSQAAIPLAATSALRVTNLYDLMDSQYDARLIKQYSRALGHVPIIEHNRRKGRQKILMEPARRQRFKERQTAERGFSMLKDNFGGSTVRVRGHPKVMTHLMFGILALTADRLLNLVI